MAENTENSWIQTVTAAITNALKAAVDETVRENAEFAYESGLSAKIVRKMSGETCEWCRAMAGTYDYGSEPPDVYRRHDNCDCTVEYVVGKDRQNVHTRQWTRSEEADKIEERKQNERTEEKAEKIGGILGLRGKSYVSIPPETIDIDALGYDSAHISERGHSATEETAKQWISEALFSATVFDGEYVKYYARSGAVYVNTKSNFIRTAYSRDEYYPEIEEAIKVFDND